MPASSGASCAPRLPSGAPPRPRHRGRRTAGCRQPRRPRGPGQHTFGPGQHGDPLVPGPGGEGGSEGRPDGGLRVVVQLRRRQLGQPSAAQRLAKNFASMAPTASHFPSGARVGAVAGVAAGQDVVARADAAAQGQVLVDRPATSATGPPRRPRRRGRCLRPSPTGPASAAVMASAACMPPAAASAMVAPGSGGAPSGPGCSWPGIPDGQVVDVVPGPFRGGSVLAVPARRAVDHTRVARPRRPRIRPPGDPRRPVGSSRPPRRPPRPEPRMPLDRPRLSGPPARGASRGGRCRRSTAAQSATHLQTEPVRP